MNVIKSAFHQHTAHRELSELLNKTHGLPLPLLFAVSPNTVKTRNSILDSLRQFKQPLPPDLEVMMSMMRELWIKEGRNNLDLLIADDKVDGNARVPVQRSKYSQQPSARTRHPQSEGADHGHF